MIIALLKYLTNWFFILIGIKILFLLMWWYLAFVFYHLNLSVYLICQSFLEPSTCTMIVMTAIAIFFIWIFKKVKSIFSF